MRKGQLVVLTVKIHRAIYYCLIGSLSNVFYCQKWEFSFILLLYCDFFMITTMQHMVHMIKRKQLPSMVSIAVVIVVCRGRQNNQISPSTTKLLTVQSSGQLKVVWNSSTFGQKKRKRRRDVGFKINFFLVARCMLVDPFLL